VKQIRLLAACQAIVFFHPLRTTTPLVKVYDLVRSVTKDRFMSPDIDAVHLLLDQKVWNVAQPYIENYKLSGLSPECCCLKAYKMEFLPESRSISPTAFSLDTPASPQK
uniref:Uncharacterized protein n=1 Tax=Hucho hucho TaxID=62062 RepID=A0A4W5PAZ1_9TELE